MTKREIALHPALLMLMVLAGNGFYAYQKSSAMVPFLIRHLDSDNLRERQTATFRLQELGNAARAAAAREFGAADVESCARRLQSAPLTRGQIEVLASRLTVDETYFFREKTNLEALEQHVFPELLRALARNATSLPASTRPTAPPA